MLGGLDYHSIATAVKRAIAALPWAAPGDLLVGSGANTYVVKSVGSDGYPLTPVSGAAGGVAWLPPALGFNLVGGYLAWTVAGSVLTVAVKTWSGADPSATEPVFYPVRDATAATGSLTYRKLTAALSISINDTALMGTTNSVAFRLWAVAFNDAGTDRLALINCLSGTNIYPLAGWGIASSTLEDNASDAAHVFYSSGAAVTSKAYSVLGYATWETGLATAGTWSAGPTRVQLFGPGVLLPGQTIQVQRTDTGTGASGTTITFYDNTIPQNTEGDQFMSQAITPGSAANILRVKTCAQHRANTGNRNIVSALFKDSVANALVATASYTDTTDFAASFLTLVSLSGGTAAITFKYRAGLSAAGTLYFNQDSTGGGIFGGVFNSYIEAEEVMA